MPDNSKLSPYLFTVEIDSIETARFQKCKGLEAETETFEFEEGGGHIIAQIFNGPGEQINYVPQAQTLNRGDWKAMENECKEADPRVEAFELKINPNNESYYLPHPQGGGYVQFENMINSTVQDGKLILNKKSFYHVDDMPDFAKNKILQEAQRQIDSAILANYKVEWLISDKSAVEQLKKLFEKNNIKIEIKFFPE